MRRLLAVSVAASLCASAFGQQSLRPRLVPITAPIRHAGVYHVATGTWTRNASLANVTGPDTIYNNTCMAAYFAPMAPTESYQHRSRIPSPSGPTTFSVFYGSSRNDEAPGCQTSYTINGFQFAYCSFAVTTITYNHDFADSYTLCGSGDMVPVPADNVLLTGLPGGTPSAGQNCWIVDVDLSGNSNGGIILSADGDGTYVGPSTAEQFGWSFAQQTVPYNPATGTGPIIAGDFTFTPSIGIGQPCAGTDGTIWDNPINLAEEGTGMASNNFYRIAATPGPVSAPSGPGCYDFGGAPHADFWLKLYANPGCSTGGWIIPFCLPGEGGIHACTTCSPPNPPSQHLRGCNNYGQFTGGAQLSSTGASQVSADTLVFISQFENSTAFTVLMQGTLTTNHVFGAGVRCVAGVLKRLYTGSAGSPTNGDPFGTIHRPGPDDPRSVHAASLAVGYDIGAYAPITLFYQAYYRDPNASAHCGGATFNVSQGGAVNWIP